MLMQSKEIAEAPAGTFIQSLYNFNNFIII